MPTITFEGKQYACNAGESVLESLMRQGVMLPSSCQSGACQACMVRAREGQPTALSQQGLKDTQKAQNYFLPCVCYPDDDLTIVLSDTSERFDVRLLEKELLNESVVRLRFEKPVGFDYKAGQFINLMRTDIELTRSYSLASLPGEPWLELHVKRVPDGRMSNWLFDDLQLGGSAAFFGPAGDCFYVSGDADQPMVLIGAGTGLAPLYGICRDMLAQGHKGPINLFHASLAAPGLYLEEELRGLARDHSHFHYHPCVLHGEAPAGGHQGNIAEIPAAALGTLAGYRAYLCGDPPIVNALRQHCFLSGVSMQHIHTDPFSPSA